MRFILGSCLILGCLSCARATSVPSSTVVSGSESWRSCSVARALARQFTRGLSLLGEVEPYLADDAIAFRVCDREPLSCNSPAQPFPGDCKDRFVSQRLSKTIETSWSSTPRPLERPTSYGVVFMEDRANDIVAELALRYRFAGNPEGGTASPHVWTGVTETTEDAPTIRVVIPKGHATTTQNSAIQFGEREIEP
jgi:hypothetical protein